jgi:hypothetical protein
MYRRSEETVDDVHHRTRKLQKASPIASVLPEPDYE